MHVRTGKQPLNIDSCAADLWRIFPFQSNEHYEGEPADNVTCLGRDELKAFLLDRLELFPRSFQTKPAFSGMGRRLIPPP